MLLGRLGGDPEVRYTPGGNAVCTLNVANDRRQKGDGGEWTSVANWHKCIIFGKQAEICGEKLRKGDRVFIEGEHVTRSYEQAGVKKWITELITSRVEFIDTSGNGTQAPAPHRQPPGQTQVHKFDEDDDKVPF